MAGAWLSAAVALVAAARSWPAVGLGPAFGHGAGFARGNAGGRQARWLVVALAFGALGALARLAAGTVPAGGAANAALLAVDAASLGLFAPAALALAAASRPPARRLPWTAGAVGCGVMLGLLALAFARVDPAALAAWGPESGIGLLSVAGPRAWAEIWSGAVALTTAACVFASVGEAIRAWYRRYVGRAGPGPGAAGWLAGAALCLAGSGQLSAGLAVPGSEWIGQAIAWLFLWRGAALVLGSEAPADEADSGSEAWEG